jgi:DNA-binding beta-propeller fold protein YncE
MTRRIRGAHSALLVPVIATILAACGEDDGSGPPATPETELAVVLNSVDRSLTVFAVDSPDAHFPIGLGPEGSPVALAVRGARVVVPMGIVPAAVVVDLEQRAVVHSIALPENSGATGAAFIDDTLALVTNPNRNSVSVINVLRGTAGEEIEVGEYPQAIVAVGDTAYVINARLGPEFAPTGPGTITVLAGVPPAVIDMIELSGLNPGDGAAGADGRLYVVHSGRFGEGDGSLSVVDRGTRAEHRHHTGFGEFPGAIALGNGGRTYIASFGYGIAVWDATTTSFIRSPANAIAPGGVPSSSGVGVDGDGRVYAFEPECTQAARVFRLTASYEVETEVPVGVCPIAIAFTVLR